MGKAAPPKNVPTTAMLNDAVTRIETAVESLRPPPIPEGARLLLEQAERDARQLADRLKAWSMGVVLHYWDSTGIVAPRPYLLFHYEVVNASFFRVMVGKEIKGLVKMDGTDLTSRLEVERPLDISHGESANLTLKQYLSGDDINDLQGWHKSDTVPFDVTGVNVSIVTHPPKGIDFSALHPEIPDRLRLWSPVYLRVTGLMW
jgi:hypothetical protein